MKTKTKINILSTIDVIIIIALDILASHSSAIAYISEAFLAIILVLIILAIIKLSKQYKQEKIDAAETEEEKIKINAKFVRRSEKYKKIMIIWIIISVVIAITTVVFLEIYVRTLI